MKKVVFFLAFMLLALCGAIGNQHSSAQATPATRSGACLELYSAYKDGLSYPCPPTPAPTPANGTAGFGAYEFNDKIGMNVHMAYAEYSNFNYVNNLLLYLNMHHTREGASIVRGNQYVINSLNTFGSEGIKSQMLSSAWYGVVYSLQSFTDDLSLLNPGDIDAVEGPNELDISCWYYNNDCHYDANWVNDDIFQTEQVIAPYGRIHHVRVVAPVTGALGYEPLGNLSPYVDEGNTHDYSGGFYPEQAGYGGVSYGGYGYGSILYNMAKAAVATPTKPIMASEFGYEQVNFQQNKNDELSQGVYTLRQILYQIQHGMPHMYIYALFDSGGQHYGLVDQYNYHPRQALQEIGGFMQVAKDATPYGQPCTVPATATLNPITLDVPPNIMSMGLCYSDGRKALILWQPAVTYDANAMTDNIIPGVTANIAFYSGFTPTSSVLYADTPGGPWTISTVSDLTQVPVTDRPRILMFNGPSSPTPVPAPPTTPPTPVATATPTIAPTPTPAPTATPTTVAIRQFATNLNSSTNNVNVTTTFNSSPHYGDYLLSGWSFTQFGAARYIVNGPSILSRIDPGSNEITKYTVPIVCAPFGDYEQYETTCEDLWGGYVTDQSYNNTNLSWAASAGQVNSAVTYDFSGADASAPIAQIATYLGAFRIETDYGNSDTECPSVTAPRIGSVAVCIIAAKNGTGFGPGIGMSNGYTNNGWIFDQNQIPVEASTYSFHYPATTTANQVIPSFNAPISGTYLDYAVSETVVIQPPAH